MFVRCCRCGDPAGVAMTFNYQDRRVWLDDLTETVDLTGGYPLCDSHSSRMTPPVGWALADRRQVLCPLFVSREVA